MTDVTATSNVHLIAFGRKPGHIPFLMAKHFLETGSNLSALGIGVGI
ncbi:hypothetical protein [Rhizobium sp. Kim5]|nr:hypothetical protein [Rhizobium sp. Kim5]